MTAALSASAAFGPALPARATSAYERMRSRIPAEAGTTATVRTRKVDLKLGGFGFTYTSKDLELGPDIPTQAARTSGSVSMQAPLRTQEADTSASTRTRGLSAYAAQLRQRQEDSLPSSVLLSVV